ncbi:MAG: GTP cyclohydrolase I, partial [Microbacterium sp.]
DARGVLVVLDATHGCVTMRGGRQPEASTVTIAARGAYADAVERAELIALIGAGPGPADWGGPSESRGRG